MICKNHKFNDFAEYASFSVRMLNLELFGVVKNDECC